jgi:hypothetical protein
MDHDPAECNATGMPRRTDSETSCFESKTVGQRLLHSQAVQAVNTCSSDKVTGVLQLRTSDDGGGGRALDAHQLDVVAHLDDALLHPACDNRATALQVAAAADVGDTDHRTAASA